MARSTITTFTVRGTYGFPFDMLRYDQAWPTSRGVTPLSAVTRGENINQAAGRDPRRDPVEVELQTAGNGPTDERWSSFGWRVVDVRRERY